VSSYFAKKIGLNPA